MSTSYTPPQQRVLEVLRSGGSLYGERSATESYTNITLKGPSIWPGEDVHPATVSSLLRRKEIMVYQESPGGSVYFRLVEPSERMQWIIDDLQEKLSQEEGVEETLTVVAMGEIIEELVTSLPERVRKQVQKPIQRFLDQVREKQRGDSSEEESGQDEEEQEVRSE
jgi:hypothetical protein